jgi:hypothetical protein
MQLALPYTFTNGGLIDAGQMNANFAAVTGAFSTSVRTALAGPTTFYVAPGGVDAPGNGLAIASPTATIAYILNLLRTQYDLNNQTVTIQLANGTYNESVNHAGGLPGLTGAFSLRIQGNTASPSSVVWGGDPCLNASNGALVSILGVTLQSSISSCIIAITHAVVLLDHVVFGTTMDNHMLSARGAVIEARNDYAISGGAVRHAMAMEGGKLFIDVPPGNFHALPWGTPIVTLTGTPAFSGAFAVASTLGYMRIGATFSGLATGPQWSTSLNGVINTVGHKASLPGNVAGTDVTGGQSS